MFGISETFTIKIMICFHKKTAIPDPTTCKLTIPQGDGMCLPPVGLTFRRIWFSGLGEEAIYAPDRQTEYMYIPLSDDTDHYSPAPKAELITV